MNRIKCVNCGFVSWATAGTCKKCGAQLSESHEAGSLSQSTHATPAVGAGAPIDTPIKEITGHTKRVSILLAVIVLIALSAGVFAFKNSDPNRPQVFVLKDGSKKSSKAWFQSWFSSDPTVDEIVAQYLKVGGWEANPSELRNFVGKGRFQIKNEPGDHVVETMDRPHIQVHFHWSSVDGEIEFESEAPDKFVMTQKYDDVTVSQRGTNGTTGWLRKGFPDKSAEVGPHMPLIATFQTDELRGDRLTDLKRGGDFINYFQLPNKYPRLYLTGKTIVGDRVAYELTNRNFPDAVGEMYFDVETGMLLKFTSYRPGLPYIPMFERYYVPFSNNSNWAETYLEDYREVNGVRLPFLVRQHIHRYWITTMITDFKANVTIDPSVFEKPAS